MNNLNREILTNSPSQVQNVVSGFDYTADVWAIDIPRMDEKSSVDFNERFGKLEPWQKQVAKAFVFAICQQNDKTLIFGNSQGHLRTRLTHLSALFLKMNKYHMGKTFKELDDLEIVKLLATDENRTLNARATADFRVLEWNFLYELQFTNVKLVEKTYLPSRRAPSDWEKICTEHLAPEDFDVSDWLAGGSLAKVPFEVSLALLCYCVETLKSDKTKYLLAWSNWQQDYQTKPLKMHTPKRLLKIFGTGETRASEALDIEPQYFECLKRYYPNAKSLADLPYAKSNESQIPFNFKPTDSDGFIRNIQHLVTTCYVALLILAGARKSEIESIRADGIKKNGDYYIFNSAIMKTNHGVEKPRTIGSFLIPEILHVLDQISIEGLGSQNRELLFGYTLKPLTTEGEPQTRKPSNFRKYLSSFYEKFLDTEGQHLREICDHINPHGFRHTWVEFALRRFDGNIMPLIMDRLAHTGKHKLTFTPAYTDNKISMSEYKKLGKEWMFEIVKRYVDEPDVHAVFGAVGDKIRNLVDDLNILDLQNEHERNERVHEVVDKVLPDNILKPSSTVICCLGEGRERYAQCYNSKTGVAMTAVAKPPQCCACENGLICQSQLAQFELTLEEYEERYQQHQLGALANKLRAEANEDNPFGAMFAEQARKDFTAMQKMKQKIDKIRGSK